MSFMIESETDVQIMLDDLAEEIYGGFPYPELKGRPISYGFDIEKNDSHRFEKTFGFDIEEGSQDYMVAELTKKVYSVTEHFTTSSILIVFSNVKKWSSMRRFFYNVRCDIWVED